MPSCTSLKSKFPHRFSLRDFRSVADIDMQISRKSTPPATHFRAALPDVAAVGCALPVVDLHVGGLSNQLSFEDRCRSVEESITRPELGIVCVCCAADDPCLSCRYAVGFHICAKVGKTRYRKGSLYDRCLDGQRVLFNMHRKGVPTEVIEEKFVSKGHD